MNKLEAHKILGTNPQSTPEEIKKAYRRLAMKYHPDRVDESEKSDAEEKFKNAKAAFEFLESGLEDSNQANGNVADLAEILRRRGFRFSFDETGGQEDNSNVHTVFQLNIQVSLEEAFRGCVKTVSIPDVTSINGSATPTEIKIEPGISDGTIVKVIESNNNKICVVARIVSEYRVDFANPFANAIGAGNIIREYRINPLIMMIGGFVSVKTIDGSTVSVRVPAGTETATILKLKGKGYWAGPKCQHRGDCYLRMIPTVQKLNETDKELLKEFKKALDAHLDVEKQKEIKT